MPVVFSEVVFPKHIGGLINDILLQELYVVGTLTQSTPSRHQDVSEATSKGKDKAIPLPWTGPEGSRRFRLPDFKTIGA
jgi:hypothetical protein